MLNPLLSGAADLQDEIVKCTRRAIGEMLYPQPCDDRTLYAVGGGVREGF